MGLITIEPVERNGASPTRDTLAPGQSYCEQLERGHILFFPQTPFELTTDERQFLLSQQQVGASYHKNIAYRPHQNRVTGFLKRTRAEQERLREIMRAYSQRVSRFLADLLPPYADSWRIDYASFRPQEEAGRDLRLRSRNDLLHVDAFPTRPVFGDRILRVFTNINPTQGRHWVTSVPFDQLVDEVPETVRGLLSKQSEKSWRSRVRSLVRLARSLGLPVFERSLYDEFMLRFHDALKGDREFQSTCRKEQWAFPPNSTWIVFTDTVPHAVLSGRFALEQTFIVSHHALFRPEKAPIRILERLAGLPLA